jgi:hypothetical protein
MYRKLKPISQNSKKQIMTFWNYVKKNEQEIYNGLLLGINYGLVLEQFYKKLKPISTVLFFLIKIPVNDQEKHRFIFCCRGYRRIHSKAIALAEQIPPLEFFTAQAFVSAYEDLSDFKNGTDTPLEFGAYEIRVSAMRLALEDYDIARKKLKINIYLPHYNEIKEYKNMEYDIHLHVMLILGEIAFYKHIAAIHLYPMPLEPAGLLPLVELPDLIAHLYQINSRKRTRII